MSAVERIDHHVVRIGGEPGDRPDNEHSHKEHPLVVLPEKEKYGLVQHNEDEIENVGLLDSQLGKNDAGTEAGDEAGHCDYPVDLLREFVISDNFHGKVLVLVEIVVVAHRPNGAQNVMHSKLLAF